MTVRGHVRMRETHTRAVPCAPHRLNYRFAAAGVLMHDQRDA